MPQRVVGAAIEDVEAARPPRADGWGTYRDAANFFKTTARQPGRAIPILVIDSVAAAPNHYVYAIGSPGNRGRSGSKRTAAVAVNDQRGNEGSQIAVEDVHIATAADTTNRTG